MQDIHIMCQADIWPFNLNFDLRKYEKFNPRIICPPQCISHLEFRKTRYIFIISAQKYLCTQKFKTNLSRYISGSLKVNTATQAHAQIQP